MVIFTHYPINPDDDDINKSNKIKNEIINELNKIFKSSENLVIIPIYFINTKIIKKDGKASFIRESQTTLSNLLNNIPKNNGNNLRIILKEIQIKKNKYIDLMQTIFLQTQVKTQKHIHGVVLLYSNFDWVCDICRLSKFTSESKYHCSLCDFNICNNCIETKIKYPLN